MCLQLIERMQREHVEQWIELRAADRLTGTLSAQSLPTDVSDLRALVGAARAVLEEQNNGTRENQSHICCD